MKKLLGILLLCASAHALGPGAVVNNILGIEPALATSMTQALEASVGAGTDFGDQSEAVTEFLARAMLNEVPVGNAVRTVGPLVEALNNGAPRDDALDIAEIGFTDPITADQIQSACRARQLGRQLNLDPAIVDEVILDCVVEERTGSIIEGIILGLEKGIRSGVRQDKCAVALLVRFAQGTEGKSVKEVVDEEIEFVKSHRDEKEKQIDSRMDRMYEQGIDRSIVREIYGIALEEKWKNEELDAVFAGIQNAHKRGIMVEKAALAFVIRIAQGYEGSLPDELQKELKALEKPPEPEIEEALETATPTKKKQPPPVAKSVRSSPAKEAEEPSLPRGITVKVFEKSMQSFLTARAPSKPASTPYKWGGTTRRGVDCSGFTSVCYKESGIHIPRVSRDQYAHFKKKGQTVSRKRLRYGDLVFFSSNGGKGRITHVGVYYKKNRKGQDLFVQSSCTPGVNICNLSTNRYWAPRYCGAVRVVN